MYEGEEAKKSPEEKKMKNITKMIIAIVAMLTLITIAATAVAAKNENRQTVGGWSEPEVTEITPEMQEIFDEATDKLIGVNYKAVELLETQLVNGTNYKFLAESQVVYPGAQKKTVIITVYRDLAGNVSVLDIAEQ